MNKHLIPQIYGYVVCLVTIIVVIFNLISVISHSFDLKKPELSMECSYLATQTEPLATDLDSTKNTASTDFKTCVERAKFNATRDISTGGILTILAIIGFVIHWRWVNKLRDN